MPLHLPDINPIIFGLHLGPVAIRWYAVAYVAGIVAGWLYIGRLLRTAPLWAPRQAPVTSDQLDDLILWVTLGVILGGRIGYILFYDASIVWIKPLDVFKIWEGGMSFHGGIAGVTVATLVYCRAHRFDGNRILNLGDAMACVAPIGLGLGRLANFVNGELWGRPTTVPWAMDFCNTYIKKQYNGVCPADFDPLTQTYHAIGRHPSQLYEAIGEGVILFGLLWVLSRRVQAFRRPGLCMGVFIAGYGIIRILLENVRQPDEQMLGFFKNVITMGQLLSLIMLLTGSFFVWRALRQPVDLTPDVPADTAPAGNLHLRPQQPPVEAIEVANPPEELLPEELLPPESLSNILPKDDRDA